MPDAPRPAPWPRPAPLPGLGAAALLALLAGGGAGAGEAIPPGRAADLERLVRRDCGSCHGMRLSGGLGPDIRAGALSEIPTETVTAIILDGLPGTAMPPWRPLITREEAQWIAAYLKSAE